MKKKILVIVAIIVGIIFLDSLQAFIFNNNPLLSIKKYQNGGDLNYISKGLLIDTYNCSNGKKDATIKGFSYSCSKAKDHDYKIVDTSKDIDGFVCNQVLEEIFRDDKYIYYLPCEKSKYIKVIYNENNYQESLKSSLKEGYIHISELDKFGIEYIKKELAEMWKLETEQVVIRDVNTDIIKEQLNKVDNLEVPYLTLSPPRNIGETRYIQTYNDINVGNAKNETEKFHIEICINDKVKEFKLMAKDNLTREEVEKIFIDYFENSIIPDISDWYEL